ncbi:hypothetical protein [Marinitenerispora sediminis]|uniref:Uncharacterized protein n=1 Tax=Marinitenerispora sediminis TaxID=1931232 RepID=A0A368T3S8_9ACTN|nr:hypothetical protein [Marinitenerispora sediminis]RCV49713.1 hypothetical protein DEF28_20155 [Marinitenerispora sediminis]RCV53353.1 hypothetical protein DEF23_17750 [Marinitenerispora sediminis]RCV57565.1 hypothetical protein DEF24_15065 [Marinitenerispora sediminis]
MIKKIVLGLLVTLLGVALLAAAFYLGGVATFNTMRYFHVGCVPWPETNPPQWDCDNMGYVIPVLLGGLVTGLLTVTAYTLLLRRLRHQAAAKLVAGLLASLLITVAGMAPFAYPLARTLFTTYDADQASEQAD